MSQELVQLATHEDNTEFWRFISAGEFRMQKCTACQKFRYPCSWICPHCGSNDSTWEMISGVGVVYTWTIIHKDYNPSFEKKAPYNVAVIALAEGVHFLSNVECALEDLQIGMKVKAVIQEYADGSKVPRFYPI